MIHKYLGLVLFMGWAILVGFLVTHSFMIYLLAAVMSIVWFVLYGEQTERNIQNSINLLKECGQLTFHVDTMAIYYEDKIVTATKDAETLSSYSDIEKIIVGQSALYLYKNAVSEFILPYRIFAGDEEKEAFIRFIKKKTNALWLTA